MRAPSDRAQKYSIISSSSRRSHPSTSNSSPAVDDEPSNGFAFRRKKIISSGTGFSRKFLRTRYCQNASMVLVWIGIPVSLDDCRRNSGSAAGVLAEYGEVEILTISSDHWRHAEGEVEKVCPCRGTLSYRVGNGIHRLGMSIDTSPTWHWQLAHCQ